MGITHLSWQRTPFIIKFIAVCKPPSLGMRNVSSFCDNLSSISREYKASSAVKTTYSCPIDSALYQHLTDRQFFLFMSHPGYNNVIH